MIKLFLVEDEAIIRDGIKKHIDWESEGIEFAGEAGDGELALPMILETKPDILITDIKMPFMNGLTLAAHVRRSLPETEIVVLSGYNDFNYAQEAIALGVTQYLLKPITRVRLMECIRPIRDEIERKRKERRRSIDFDEILSRESLSERLTEFMKTGTEDEVPGFIGELKEQIGEVNQGSFLFSVYMLTSMYLTMLRFAREFGLSKEELERRCGSISCILTDIRCNEEGLAFLSDCLREVIRVRDSSKNRNSGILQALSYIDGNFTDADISLNRVAAAVNMSSSHFSACFSQEMGQTFIDYLIRKRIDRAKELLMTTDLHSGEICYLVGYRDPQYFSSTFKRVVGMTPTAFRTRGRQT